MPSSQFRNTPRLTSNPSNRSMARSQTSWQTSSAALRSPPSRVIDHAKDVADVALVHDGPSRSVAPGHCPQQTEFVVHRPTALVVWFPLPEYCRERAKSFAVFSKKSNDPANGCDVSVREYQTVPIETPTARPAG